MANNCLISQLKDVVNNNKLVKVDELLLTVNKKSSISDATFEQGLGIAYNATEHGVIKVTAPGKVGTAVDAINQDSILYSTDSGTTASIFFKNDDYYIKLSNKSNIKILLDKVSSRHSIYSINLSDLEYCISLQQFRIRKNPNVKGNIKYLGKLTSLTMCRLDGTQATGELVEFVKAQRAAGRTTCADNTFSFGVSSLMTFNGIPCENMNTYLSWTENTITYNGVTVNV